jgi:hypothetical protein
MPDKKPDPVDATTSVSPQPSIDPVYQAGKTVGGTDKSPRPPRTVAPSNLRSVLPRSSSAEKRRLSGHALSSGAWRSVCERLQ